MGRAARDEMGSPVKLDDQRHPGERQRPRVVSRTMSRAARRRGLYEPRCKQGDVGGIRVGGQNIEVSKGPTTRLGIGCGALRAFHDHDRSVDGRAYPPKQERRGQVRYRCAPDRRPQLCVDCKSQTPLATGGEKLEAMTTECRHVGCLRDELIDAIPEDGLSSHARCASSYHGLPLQVHDQQTGRRRRFLSVRCEEP